MPDPPGIPSRNLRPKPPPPPVELAASEPEPDEPMPTGHVRIGNGFSMPSMVALALIASVGGFATAWLNKPPPGDPAELLKTWRAEAALQKAERAAVDAQLIKRLDGQDTKLDRLQDSQDRLRERFNERFAEGK